ncbi:MAG TPA: RNA 2',3'-cyclic phosphodiesterase [Gaiellaceae bacterium]|nr:RNA 2',3'-cyclic phosphodiesterase [Gaiellaceae bacterium]
MNRPATVGGDERLRLFCALRLPDDVLDRLQAWQDEQLAGRIVPRENLHATLAFLGSRPASELPEITAALAEASRAAGEIVFSPRRYRETRSVGMLVFDDQSGEGRHLAERLYDGLERLGVYRREKRPWLPHVTVLRFRSPPKLDPVVPELGTFGPSDAAVYMSRLRPSGAQYEALETVALGG